MKSPWKFLSGLARRHDKQDAPDVDVASSDSDKSSPVEQAIGPIEPEDAAVLKETDQGGADSTTREEPRRDEVLVAPVSATKPEEVEAVEKHASKERAAIRTRGNKAVRHRRAESTKVAPPPVATPSESAHELDDEINELRTQLAKKLELQNAQLRRMLARFEN
ncbi:hypothetical protein [Rhizobium sp. S96]|uniref:hypothetical protein n=1 Tax=Rhizobium sp. S96 TaxID=3055140 RepID=UPI0025AA6154|nr:hypothetical protein [Rhizobium sp. S96]MDM9620464.1 hypothetical protein [Rhizobium sp. S96]